MSIGCRFLFGKMQHLILLNNAIENETHTSITAPKENTLMYIIIIFFLEDTTML